MAGMYLFWQLGTGIILDQRCGFALQVHEVSHGSRLGEILFPYACSLDEASVAFPLFIHGLFTISLVGHGLVRVSLSGH